MKPRENESLVQIPVDTLILEGNLNLPIHPIGMVLFAHGSGSSRHSPRNQAVARVLEEAHLGTLLVDLLTADEEQEDRNTGHLRFDIDLLAKRLVGVIEWLKTQVNTQPLNLGLFGASTGAAAALIAAAEQPYRVHAVVSRGGRPDLAARVLPQIQVPTLLIVGGNDRQVVKMNQDAFEHILAVKRMEIVEGASHLFEEPGALDQVAQLAREWFRHYLKV